MRVVLRMTALTLALMLTGAACGGGGGDGTDAGDDNGAPSAAPVGDEGPSGEAKSPSDIEPCDLLTAAEVSDAFGDTFGPATRTDPEEGALQCHYGRDDEILDALQLTVNVPNDDPIATPKSLHEAGKDTSLTPDVVITPVSALGEDAYYEGPGADDPIRSINVLVNDELSFTLRALFTPGADDDMEAPLRTLAELVLERLVE